MSDERKLSEDKRDVIEKFLAEFMLRSYPGTGGKHITAEVWYRKTFYEMLPPILSYADRRREMERCKWTETEIVASRPPQPDGFKWDTVFSVECDEDSIMPNTYTFCPFCGKRVEVIPIERPPHDT